MYYGDLLVAAEKDITSRNFCILVDAAAMLYEEEKRKSKTKKMKTLSEKEEEEEESDKRFFPVFPRKPRTLVKKFVTKRNLNGASSSSSSLLDLNPQNPSSSFLGDFKIAAEMRNPQKPNSQLSPSSWLAEKQSRKRRAVQDTKRTGKSKKPKVGTFSWIGKETPEWLIKRVRDMNGSDLRLISERNLFKTDVNPGESRLSMPFNELIHKDFLTPVESRIIEEDILNDKKMGIGAILVDQQNVKWGVMLKRWEMKRDSGKGSWTYALTCGWNDVVKGNGLKEGDDVSIWSFRWRELLCFALVLPPPAMAQSSSSLDLSLKL